MGWGTFNMGWGTSNKGWGTSYVGWGTDNFGWVRYNMCLVHTIYAGVHPGKFEKLEIQNLALVVIPELTSWPGSRLA